MTRQDDKRTILRDLYILGFQCRDNCSTKKMNKMVDQALSAIDALDGSLYMSEDEILKIINQYIPLGNSKYRSNLATALTRVRKQEDV